MEYASAMIFVVSKFENRQESIDTRERHAHQQKEEIETWGQQLHNEDQGHVCD